MKNIIVTLSAVLLLTAGYSQTDFRGGVIVTPAGDTVAGLINYREGAAAYRLCQFKKSANEAPTSYEPGEISAYGFTGDSFFQSRVIPGDDQTSAPAFLEVLVRGQVSLYRFENTYFVEKGTGSLQRLTNEAKEVQVGETTTIKKTNEHISILSMLLFDCVEIRPEIQKAELSERSLTNLVEKYNRYMGGPSVTFKTGKPWIKTAIALAGGVHLSTIEFQKNADFKHLSGNFETTTSPVLGISLNVSSPRLTERFSFRTDAFYNRTKYYGHSITETPPITHRDYVTINIQALKLNPGFQYTFPENVITPYVNGGLSIIFHVDKSSSRIQEIDWYGVVETFDHENALTLENNQMGFWVGVGGSVTIANTIVSSLEFRYEKTDGVSAKAISSNRGISSDIANLQIILLITKK